MNFSIISGAAATQPSLYPGQSILENVPKNSTRPFSSNDLRDGNISPSNLNSPYGLSSATGISYLLMIFMNSFLLSTGQVLPDGFWKSGIT